jgi:ABC-type uncharacterized transport system permease subunit
LDITADPLFQILGVGAAGAVLNAVVQLNTKDTTRNHVLDAVAPGVAMATTAVLSTPAVMYDAANRVKATTKLGDLPALHDMIGNRSWVFVASFVLLLLTLALERSWFSEVRSRSTSPLAAAVIGVAFPDMLGAGSLGLVYLFTRIR